MTTKSYKFTIHRLMENTPEANASLQQYALVLLPIGDPIDRFILCLDTDEGRKFVGAVPKALCSRVLELYNNSNELLVKWCSPSMYANNSVMWIEVFASCQKAERAEVPLGKSPTSGINERIRFI